MFGRLWNVVTSIGAAALFLSAMAIAPAPAARAADDQLSAEQLKQMYTDTLAQLKAAQERKTQLAAENEQLKAKVAELEKQLATAQTKSTELEKQVSASGEKNFYLRSHYVAWQEFLRRYPRMQIRWKTFLENDLVTPGNQPPVFVDQDWPWSAQS